MNKLLKKLNAIFSSKKNLILFIGFFGLLSLIPFIAACFYIHPNADDWFFSKEISDRGTIGFATNFYETWSGRYIANLMLGIPKSNILSNPLPYTLLPILFIFLTNFLIYKILRLFISASFNIFHSICFSLFFTGIYFTSLYEIFSALYWNCSSFYLLANAYFLLLIYLFLKMHFKNKGVKSTLFVFICLMTFVICGLSEIHIIIAFTILSFLLLYSFFMKKLIDYRYLLMLFIVLIGAYLNINSPGATNRIEYSNADVIESPNIILSALKGVYYFTILQLLPLLNSWFTIIFLLFILTGSYFLRTTSKPVQKIFNINPALSILIILACFVLQHMASIIGAGYTLQGRVINISNLLLQMSFIYLAINISKYFNVKCKLPLKNLSLITILFISVLMNFSYNSRTVIGDLTYNLPTQNKELNERYDKIKIAKQNKQNVVYVNRISVNPKTMYFGLLYDFDKNYYNSQHACNEMSLFFGINVKIVNNNYDLLDSEKKK